MYLVVCLHSSGNITWQEMTMDDHVNITSPTYEFVNCIAFSGPYNGMIGGEYNASVYTNVTIYPYARLIDDEGGFLANELLR